MSPTTVFPAAAKCMSSNGGPLWDWSPSTPDTNARHLFLTLPFNMPTTPPPKSKVSITSLILLPLMDSCCNKSNNSSIFTLLQRGETLFWHVSARLGLHHSSQCALSLSVFISFCLLCCILGKEVKIAFALQVVYVGVYKWHYKQILLY